MDRRGRFVAPAVIAAFVLAGCAATPVPAAAPLSVRSPAALPAIAATASTSTASPHAAESTPSARPTAVPLATELEGQWITAPHPIPVLAANSNAALMTLGPASFAFTARFEDKGVIDVLA